MCVYVCARARRTAPVCVSTRALLSVVCVCMCVLPLFVRVSVSVCARARVSEYDYMSLCVYMFTRFESELAIVLDAPCTHGSNEET